MGNKQKKKKFQPPRGAFFNGYSIRCKCCFKPMKYIDDKAVEKHFEGYFKRGVLFTVECKHCCYHEILEITRSNYYII